MGDNIALTPPPTTTIHTRIATDFDAGINTSAVWTESLERDHSLSDDELDEDERYDDPKANGPGRPARALYAFEGKQEFREVCVEAGDEIEVLKEKVGDGWSLVKLVNEDNVVTDLGLLPRTYYTFTADFSDSDAVLLEGFHHKGTRRREASPSSITPRASPSSKLAELPLVPQSTGEWFPSFRRSLLGGKSINRFTSFVTSGAEEWILKGAEEDIVPPRTHQKMASKQDGGDDGDGDQPSNNLAEADMHFIDERLSWRAKVPPFRVLVHSPSKRTSTLAGAYTVYSVTSIFEPEEVDSDIPTASSTRITVHRRFSHFVALHTALSRRLPGVALPPLPEKQYAGRFSDDFVEARRGDLERYIGKIAQHPVARYAEVLTFFLSCESDIEWKRLLPKHLAMPPAGPSFYARVFHPAFNLDMDETAETAVRFANHTRAVGKGVQGLRNIFGQLRQARVGKCLHIILFAHLSLMRAFYIEMSKAERLLSYSLLSLVTSKPLASASTTGIPDDYEEQNINDKYKGTTNSDGAWCWRERCQECLKLSKSMQRTSEALQNVADLYDDHARRTQLATHEALKGVSHPYSMYVPVLDSHKSTLSRYSEAVASPEPDDEVIARCETVLNTTMAEMETYHAQKVEDFQNITKEHLDGEINFYEQVLSRLRTARANFDEPQYGYLSRSPRQPSMYERELENPRLTNPPLPQPCPHVFDSAPMRPVSVAIQEGIGMFLGSGPRSSVFSKFW